MRAVAPWTWRIALRDQGPFSQSALMTLYVIGTYMDDNGYAYPGQALIARGARSSVRTVRRHLVEAKQLGWLAVEYAGRSGQGWRHYSYRCAVPDDLVLSEKSEELAETFRSQFGDPEGADTAGAPPTNKGADTAGATRTAEGAVNRDMNVGTTEAEGAVNPDINVRTQLVPTNSYSETPTYRTPTQKAYADASAPGARTLKRERKKPEVVEAEALQRAEAMAAEIRFRERQKDEHPRRYAAAVVAAMAKHQLGKGEAA